MYTSPSECLYFKSKVPSIPDTMLLTGFTIMLSPSFENVVPVFSQLRTSRFGTDVPQYKPWKETRNFVLVTLTTSTLLIQLLLGYEFCATVEITCVKKMSEYHYNI